MKGLRQIVKALNDEDDVEMQALVGHAIYWAFCYIAAEDADDLSFKDYLRRELAEYVRLIREKGDSPRR